MDKNHSNTADVIRLSVVTSFFLAVFKLTAGVLTQSMAILASALDSLMDTAASIVNWLAAREAVKPPDEDHAYGHGKIASLASLFQSLIIGVSGVFILVESVKRMLSAAPVGEIPIGIGVMVVSLLITLWLVWRLQRAAEKNKSIILATEKLHFTADFVSHGGVIAALVLIQVTGALFWDLVVSIAISGYILQASFRILKQAVNELLDASLPPSSVQQIESLIYNFHPSIAGIHNFRSRRVGDQIFLDFHVEIRGEEDFKRAHDRTEALIERIQDRYPGADVTVHYDPEGER